MCMSLTERYTDDYYASIFEIKLAFQGVGSHVIVDEIEKYREQYRMYFYYQEKKCSIVITLKIKELMNQFYNHQDDDVLHPMIQIFMLRNQKELCKKCIQHYGLHEQYLQTFDYVYSFEEDITKSFLEWLEHCTYYSFTKLLQYEHKLKHLSFKQQSFLLHHDGYFSIEQYQKELHISYETARMHLASFYHLGIISRHKVGKKNVYKGVL